MFLMRICQSQVCTKCGTERPLADFYLVRGRHRRSCRICDSARVSRREAVRKGRKNYRTLAEIRQAAKNPFKRRLCPKCGARTYGKVCKDCSRLLKSIVRALVSVVEELLKADTQCIECGRSIIPKTKRPRSFCSKACSYRANRRRRRARQRAVFDQDVTLREVAERDGWRCQLCGRRVNPLARKYTRRPVLDHIVPISRGGRHASANLQLAHFSCNSSKHAKMGGQRRLW